MCAILPPLNDLAQTAVLLNGPYPQRVYLPALAIVERANITSLAVAFGCPDSFIVQPMGLAFDILNGLQGLDAMPRRFRRIIVRAMGIEIDRTVTLRQRSFFGSSKLHFAHLAYMNVGCFIDGSDHVYVGERTHLAPGVTVLTSTHEIGPPDHRAGAQQTAPVHIGNGCWVGAKATILPGVTVADGCIIASGALVTKDTEQNGVYAGLPAVRIRDL